MIGNARWSQLEELFATVTSLPEEQRDEWLASACEVDEELRREAMALVAVERMAERDIAAVVESAAAAFYLDERIEGAHFGHWRIVREIGRGGMGTVYLAVRVGDDFEKQAAIKVVRRGIDTAAVLSRFLEERRILATLDHPYVARIIDAGTSPDGRPYFVMDLVDGLPITEYCRVNGLNTRQRCELFRKVCEPVSYAHTKLVIHRDLKPANILISPDGTPRLLDFGIARILTAPVSSDLARLTLALTPRYASPEQLRGDAVGTATDVYSLGVILGELVQGEAAQPDLSDIVAMATNAEPELRYRSADHLSEDIGRFVSREPVIAHGGGFRYVAAKFIARNRWSVTAAATAVFLLIAGVISVSWAAHLAQIQRNRAEQRVGQMVELANRALFDVHGAIERLPGAIEPRRRIVRSTLEYLDRLHRDSGEDPRVLAALATAYEQVARIEGSPLQPNLGDMRGARENYAKAEAIVAELLRRNPGNNELHLQAARLGADHAMLESETGQEGPAKELLKKSIREVEAGLAQDPDNFAMRKLQSSVLLQLGDITVYEDPGATRRADTERLPISEALVQQHPDDVDALLQLASTYSQIGISYVREGSFTGQFESFRKAAELREKAYAMRPTDATVQRDLMIIYGHLGDVLGSPFIVSKGDYRGAIGWFEKSEAVAREMVRADPSNEQAVLDLGVVLMRIGASRQAAGEQSAALRNLNEAAAILDRRAAGTPVNTEFAAQDALIHEYRGRALGRTAEGVAAWRRSLAACSRVFAVNPNDHACRKQRVVDWNGLAPLLAERGETDAALRMGRDTLSVSGEIASESNPADRAYGPRALGANGAVYAALARRTNSAERWRSAMDYYSRAVAAWRPIRGLGHPYIDEARDADAGLAEARRTLAKAADAETGRI